VLQIGRSLVRSQLVSVDFSLTKSFRSHYGPGVDSASNRNEYREYFLGGEGCRCVRLTILPSCAVVTKSGNLNFLEPSGSVQACKGTDLPFLLAGGAWSTPRPGRFTPEKDTRYIFYRRLGMQVRKISPHTGIRCNYLPNRSESLYRPSYPGPHSNCTMYCTEQLAVTSHSNGGVSLSNIAQ